MPAEDMGKWRRERSTNFGPRKGDRQSSTIANIGELKIITLRFPPSPTFNTHTKSPTEAAINDYTDDKQRQSRRLKTYLLSVSIYISNTYQSSIKQATAQSSNYSCDKMMMRLAEWDISDLIAKFLQSSDEN
jgi:hypothetical protein